MKFAVLFANFLNSLCNAENLGEMNIALNLTHQMSLIQMCYLVPSHNQDSAMKKCKVIRDKTDILKAMFHSQSPLQIILASKLKYVNIDI